MQLSQALAITVFLLSSSAWASVEAVFNRPKMRFAFENRPDNKIRREIFALLDAAVPGSAMRATFYDATDMTLAKKLGQALRRGVDVQIVLDESLGKKRFAKRVIDKLGADRVTICEHDGCIFHRGNNHNKFFIFERVSTANGAATHVVVQSSMNMNLGQRKMFQDMLIFKGDARIYEHYSRYWEDLKAQKPTAEYMQTRGLTEAPASAATVYSSPTLGPDPILTRLSEIEMCDQESRIELAGSQFMGQRAAAIAKALKSLEDRGCRVRLILRAWPGDNTQQALLEKLKLNVTLIGITQTTVHSKFLLIDAGFRDGRRQIVFTGSANFKEKSLRANDETLVEIRDPKIFAAYADQFAYIRKRTRAIF